jgi:hypothetical protein
VQTITRPESAVIRVSSHARLSGRFTLRSGILRQGFASRFNSHHQNERHHRYAVSHVENPIRVFAPAAGGAITQSIAQSADLMDTAAAEI